MTLSDRVYWVEHPAVQVVVNNPMNLFGARTYDNLSEIGTPSYTSNAPSNTQTVVCTKKWSDLNGLEWLRLESRKFP